LIFRSNDDQCVLGKFRTRKIITAAAIPIITLFLVCNIIINRESGSGNILLASSADVGVTASINHFLPYFNPALGIKISYPSNFNIQETTGNSIFILGPNTAKHVIVELHLYRNVSFGPTVTADSPNNFLHLPDIVGADTGVPINESNFTFKGHPAYRYDYFGVAHSFNPGALVQKIRSTELIVSKDNRTTYTLWFSAPPGIYSKYLPIITRIFNSFEITYQINSNPNLPSMFRRNIEQYDDIHSTNSSLDISNPSSLSAIRRAANMTIGIVKPTFTAAAYNNAFYNFYELFKHVKPLTPIYKNLSLLTGHIPAKTDSYIASFKNHTSLGAYDILKITGHLKRLLHKDNITVITDADADAAKALRKSFDILILGHQEYVTQREYSNLKKFVNDGGILVCLDGNIFYAEVKYNKLSQTVTLITGHYHNFNGKTAWRGPPNERWERETSQWLGSNFYRDGGPGNRLSFVNNPVGYRTYEEQYISNSNSEILFDYGAVRGNPSPPIIATFQKTYGQGKVIVMGIYSDMVISNPNFQLILDKILLKYAIPDSNS
jgi:hypothetical protein